MGSPSEGKRWTLSAGDGGHAAGVPGIPDRATLTTTSERVPGSEDRQGEGTGWSLAPFPYDWPPERQPISFHHARGTDRAECYRMN